ncbi:MAG: transglycosylase SLT domain-containing protein [bacterium]|nr:transglycosylase SLT domain-containing protein [bacterium]
MRRRTKYDLYIVIGLAVVTLGYFLYTNISASDKGIQTYSDALKPYKDGQYEIAYKKFGKVPSASPLKEPALFRQARCATNMDKKDLAIKKYNKIIHSGSKSSIVPISEYNMATLMFEQKDSRAQKHFKKIIKKHPTSDYAIASEYYLGLIETEKTPKTERGKKKTNENALNYFKTYIEKSPDGRFAVNSAEEIIKLNLPLKNYENLLIAKAYYSSGDYEKSKTYLNKTTLSDSWADFAKTEYKLKNTDKVKYYTEYGLKDHAYSVTQEDAYEVIDNYIKLFTSRKDGINALVAKNYTSTGADYITYLNCSEVQQGAAKEACFKGLYEKYTSGQFAADALYNLFITKYLQKRYLDAQRLGYLHIRKFPDTKSSPAVMYFMGKISYKLKHYENANSYYKQVVQKYPDSYYAYRANCNLYKDDGAFPFLNMTPKLVVFPYKKSMENNLVIRLALLKDYDLVDELCKKDKFIQSWIAYEKGNYTISALLARNAMEDMTIKPPFSDLRWRLIYPLHYFNYVEKHKGNNNPIILQSIIKEESHFNPYVGSGAGAKGLMQLMPATYNEIVANRGLKNDIFFPEGNIEAGSIYYQNLKKVLGNKDLYAIAAYNGGIGSVTSWFSKITYNDTDEFVEQIPYLETKNYVKKVLRTYWVYGNIY